MGFTSDMNWLALPLMLYSHSELYFSQQPVFYDATLDPKALEEPQIADCLLLLLMVDSRFKIR
jgi:hypothetical protein